MKRSGEGIVSALAFEFVPAGIFGSATAFATATALAMPRLGATPMSAGAGAFALSWLLLRRLGSGTKPLPLADFDQSELEREFARLADEVQQRAPDSGELLLEDELPALTDDELLLEEQLPPLPEDSRVVRLFDPRFETAGEMQQRIKRHLDARSQPRNLDATQELHEALSALRQSLR